MKKNSLQDIQIFAEIQSKAMNILESLPASVLLLDNKGIIRYYNSNWKKSVEKMKYKIEEYGKGSKFTEVVTFMEDNIHNILKQNLNRLLNEEKKYFNLIYNNLCFKEEKWFKIRGKVIEDTGEKDLYRVIIQQEDITSIKKMEQNLLSRIELESLIIEISRDFFNLENKNIKTHIEKALRKINQFTDLDFSYIYFLSSDNSRVTDKIESNRDSGSDYFIINNRELYSLKESSQLIDKLKSENIIKFNSSGEIKDNFLKKFYESRDVQSILIIPLKYNNELEGFIGFESSVQYHWSDIEVNLFEIAGDIFVNALKHKKASEKITYLSFHDKLTGLYNRFFMEEELERLDTERQLPLSIIMGDINNLKLINDSLGHKKGDRLIKKAGEVIKDNCREEDIIARWGGDEFVILLPQTELKYAEKVVNRIQENANKIQIEDIPLSIAFGCSVKRKMEENIDNIIQKADDHMYKNKLTEKRSVRGNLLSTLIKALETKSNETKEHSMRMVRLAYLINEKINLSSSEFDKLSLLAQLHDIGKIAISEKILKKTGPLAEKEWREIRKHPETGYSIIKSSTEFSHIAEEVLTHHEYWNGKGYPRGLKKRNIPFLARILTIIDAFDVMTHDRPYKEAKSITEAINELKQCAGSQFDPYLVENFVDIIKMEYL